MIASLPSFFTSFLAGLLSFLSPCVLPLIPIYISFITGESLSDLQKGNRNKFSSLIKTLFFSLGFTLVFVILAIIFGGGMKLLGSGLNTVINKIAGLIIILLGLNFLFDFIPFLRADFRKTKTPQSNSKSNTKAFLLGVSFAAGWTPCVGPILSSLLLFAGQGGDILKASLLLTIYSLGFALPFFLVGLFFGQALPILNWFKKHMRGIQIISALLLFAFGIIMLFGGLSSLPILIIKAGYWFEEVSINGPKLFRPIALILSRWFLFSL